MNKQDALSILKTHEAELRSRGVKHAALFGSFVRGDMRPDSDIDILIELEENNIPDVFSYSRLIDYICQLFPRTVDVANKMGLKPHVRPSAEREAVNAF